MKLIVGLGNPGDEYKNTRHNVGFIAIDHYVGNIDWKKKFNGLYYDTNISGEKVIFIKPTTYMNLSGNCIIEFKNFYKVDTNDILVIHDDLDLPFLKYRLKYKSSCGGHNGMRSIINSLGTDEIPRLKIGIAHDRSMDTKDYVLSNINKKDLEELNKLCNTFNNIIDTFIKGNIDDCMMKFNTK
ncbi:MAG: aminoacyl-tRNA hydrolase [Candidatus Coprovivens sp.]